jgi:hypothetical protein
MLTGLDVITAVTTTLTASRDLDLPVGSSRS